MGIALRNPDFLLGLSSDSATVADGAVMVVSPTNNSACALPTAANTRARVLGLCRLGYDGTKQGSIELATSGVYPCIALGAIARGDAVVVGNASGHVQAYSVSTPPDASVVGVAMEAAASTERVAVLLLRDALRNGSVTAFVADGAITTSTIVVTSATTDNRVRAPAGADPTSGVVGAALNTVTDGQTVYVVTHGPASVTMASNVTRGDFVAVNGTTGQGKTAALGAGVNTHVVGVALASASGGAAGLVMVAPNRIQG